MFIIWANLDAEARWTNQTLPKHVLEKISAAAVTLAAFAPVGEPVELWTPAPVDAARVSLPDVTVRVGVPAVMNLAWAKPHTKAANDRRVALAVHEWLGTTLPGQRVITSIDELASVSGPWVAKAPWTAAGRDRAHGDGPPAGELAVHVTRLLERFGGLLFEPWCERILDLGICGSIDASGAVTLHAPHTLLSDARGNFVGIRVAPPELNDAERAQLDRYVAEAARALHALEYSGAFGVDAFVHRTSETELPVFVVLREDTYETKFGDGYHAYLERAFRTRAEADAAAAEANALPHDPAQMPYRFHVRDGALAFVAGAWRLTCELRENESAAAEAVAKLVGAGRALHACEINARLTFGHVAHALADRFGATELGFGEPPEGARVLVEGSAWIQTSAIS